MSNELKRMLHSHCVESDDPVQAMDDFLGWLINFRQEYVENDTSHVPFRDNHVEKVDAFWRGVR